MQKNYKVSDCRPHLVEKYYSWFIENNFNITLEFCCFVDGCILQGGMRMSEGDVSVLSQVNHPLYFGDPYIVKRPDIVRIDLSGSVISSIEFTKTNITISGILGSHPLNLVIPYRAVTSLISKDYTVCFPMLEEDISVTDKTGILRRNQNTTSQKKPNHLTRVK